MMETYMLPFIGDRPVADVEVRKILEPLTAHLVIWIAKPETARRVLQRIEAVFNSAILRGYRERVSPCVGVKEKLGVHHQKGASHRALHHRRIPAFLTELRNNRFTLRRSWRWSGRS
jgi:hypothetical protein